ncbi:hypothetical protein MCP1_6110001 [Candidatus Terasakiella magnetica]|nr:hypothetical protein MCP1_6110001 [Candidatus Terasakiella magnetica]
MGIYNGTLDIRELCVMLEGSQVQTSLFTQLSNTRAIIMTEHTISKNGISNIWVSH